MALNIKIQLSNSEGLMEIILFEGLSHSVVIHPTIHGEPLLTAQAFYYLEQLESVAEIRFESGVKSPSETEMEYLIDNYLFEYSKINAQSKVSTKLTGGKYWAQDMNDMYAFYDQKNTEALVLDALNDDSIKSIKSFDPSDTVDFNDWCIVKNYSGEIFGAYLKSLSSLINKKVVAFIEPTECRDGYIGKLRILKCDFGLVDYYQAQSIDNISIRDIKPDATSVNIKSTSSTAAIESIPIRRVCLKNRYNPTLLSYYFSGLKEHNPLLAFVGFYNVLEFYFEEAPRLLGKSAKTESEQLKCVIEFLTTSESVNLFITDLDQPLREQINKNIETSSEIEILKLSLTGTTPHTNELGRWLYEIRCAIVHSKKTRKGNPTAIFEPYSAQANNILPAIPIAKWLAILCIEKDFALSSV